VRTLTNPSRRPEPTYKRKGSRSSKGIKKKGKEKRKRKKKKETLVKVQGFHPRGFGRFNLV
jgi:hypothetical protein